MSEKDLTNPVHLLEEAFQVYEAIYIRHFSQELFYKEQYKDYLATSPTTVSDFKRVIMHLLISIEEMLNRKAVALKMHQQQVLLQMQQFTGYHKNSCA